jgi:hypothetical protein
MSRRPVPPATPGLLGTVVKALTTDVGILREPLEPSQPDDASVETTPDKLRGKDFQSVQISTDLRALLDRATGSRRVFKHLAMLEIRVRLEGAEVVDTLPLITLEKVASQLENVLPNPIPQGVAALRARIDVALLARERELRLQAAQARTRPGGLAAPSTFLNEKKLVVGDASLTDFDREHRSWALTMPYDPKR